MSEARDTLAWLARWQGAFAEALLTPLDARTGTLRATAAPPPGVSPPHGFSAYQRQYWFRLFTAMQTEFPLTARVLGLWRFNQVAQDFLRVHPLRAPSLHAIAEGFVEHLDAKTGEAAVREAARIDEAWRAVLAAPEGPAWSPRVEEAARLPRAKLRPAPTWRIVEDRFELMATRRALPEASAEGALALPPAGEVRSWLLARTREGTIELPLDPVEARLFKALCESSLAEALVAVDAACDDPERARLAAMVRDWIARSVALAMWLEPEMER